MFQKKREQFLLYIVVVAVFYIWLPIIRRLFNFVAVGYWRVLNNFQSTPDHLMISNEIGMSRGMLTICLISFFTFPLLWNVLKKSSIDDDGNPLLTLFSGFVCSLGAVYFVIVSCLCYNVFMQDSIICHEFGKIKQYSWEDVSSVRLNCSEGMDKYGTQTDVGYELLMKDGRRINMYYTQELDKKLMHIEKTYLENKKHIVENVDGNELDAYFSDKMLAFIYENFTD